MFDEFSYQIFLMKFFLYEVDDEFGIKLERILINNVKIFG
jgi:hypothetical protein